MRRKGHHVNTFFTFSPGPMSGILTTGLMYTTYNTPLQGSLIRALGEGSISWVAPLARRLQPITSIQYRYYTVLMQYCQAFY